MSTKWQGQSVPNKEIIISRWSWSEDFMEDVRFVFTIEGYMDLEKNKQAV